MTFPTGNRLALQQGTGWLPPPSTCIPQTLGQSMQFGRCPHKLDECFNSQQESKQHFAFIFQWHLHGSTYTGSSIEGFLACIFNKEKQTNQGMKQRYIWIPSVPDRSSLMISHLAAWVFLEVILLWWEATNVLCLWSSRLKTCVKWAAPSKVIGHYSSCLHHYHLGHVAFAKDLNSIGQSNSSLCCRYNQQAIDYHRDIIMWQVAWSWRPRCGLGTPTGSLLHCIYTCISYWPHLDMGCHLRQNIATNPALVFGLIPSSGLPPSTCCLHTWDSFTHWDDICIFLFFSSSSASFSTLSSLGTVIKFPCVCNNV